MAKNGFLLLAVFVAVTFQQAYALKCWRCSSDASSAAFCGDPFEPSIINEQQRRWSYVDCSFPPSQQPPFGQIGQIGQSTRPVCKKMKQQINDKLVVSRSCSWEDINAPTDSCMRTTTPSYIKTEFCETCGHDGCNGASNLAINILFVLVPLIPAFIAKLLSM
jgi:hypothetical protein